MPSNKKPTQETFATLVAIMAKLRGDEGCPWDQAQTHASLRKYLIEETYEVIDAIDTNDMASLCEELGDVLLQVVFHAQLAKEAGAFDIHDVVHSLSEKLIRRHPHVFGDTKAADPDAVLEVWQSVKRAEHAALHREDGPESLMDGVPRHLPALMLAEALGKRAGRVGFDWPNAADVWAKVLEEQTELHEAVESLNAEAEPSDAHPRVTEEWGDLVFSLVNLARHLKVEPELTLRQAAQKFENRFRAIELLAHEGGKALGDLTLAELDALWAEAKGLE